MFDIGFSEIALIAVVALIVLGPERLPRVARTAGALLRRARNSWIEVRSEIERELAAEDLKRSVEETRRAADAHAADVRNAAGSIERSLRDASTPPAADPAPASSSTNPDPASDERR